MKTPTGATITRRFRRGDPLALLFHFASQEMNVQSEKLQLSTRFPPRVFTWQDTAVPTDVSFNEAGITAAQEIFLASLIA